MSSLSRVIFSQLSLFDKDLSEELRLVSNFMRTVVCEILLRDVEGLVDRYLKKTRKVVFTGYLIS